MQINIFHARDLEDADGPDQNVNKKNKNNIYPEFFFREIPTKTKILSTFS